VSRNRLCRAEGVPEKLTAAPSFRNSDERKFDLEDPNCLTTPSYHRAQEMRVMHEFKESTCEVLNPTWDDA
jgi:hypothetical protein